MINWRDDLARLATASNKKQTISVFVFEMFIKKQLNVRVKQPTAERSSPLSSSTSAWPIAACTPNLSPLFCSHIRAQIKWFCFSIGSATERMQRPTAIEIQCTCNCNQNAHNTINAKVCLDFVICECWEGELGMWERERERAAEMDRK